MVEKTRVIRKTTILLSIFLGATVLVFVISAVYDSLNPEEIPKKLDELAKVLLPGFLVFASIWSTSCYLHLQLYSNRYPVKILKSFYQTNALLTVALIAVTVCFGSFSLMMLGKWSLLSFVVVAIASIVVLLLQSFYASRTLMLNTYIERYLNSIIDNIKGKGSAPTTQAPSNNFGKIGHTYCECLSRHEYFVCITIFEQLSKLFRVQLEECNKRMLGDCGQSQVEMEFDKLIRLMNDFVGEIKDNSPDYFIRRIMSSQAQVMKDVVETGNYNLYKRYLKALLVLTFSMVNDEKKNITKRCYGVIAETIRLTSSPELENYLDYCINECESMSLTAYFAERDASVEYYAYMLVAALNDAFERKDEAAAVKLFDAFERCSTFAAQTSDSYGDLVKFHLVVFHNAIEYENEVIIDKHLLLLEKTYCYLVEDENWSNCIYLFLESLESRFGSKWTERANKLRVHMVSLAITSSREPSYIVLPNYSQILASADMDSASVKAATEDFILLIEKSLFNNRPGLVYFLFEKLNECILSLEVNRKDLQKELLDVYFRMLEYILGLENGSSLTICLSLFEKCIRSMDKESLVSEDLGSYLVREFFSIAEVDADYQKKTRSSVLNVLFGLMKKDREVNFLYKKLEVRKKYYSGFFSIGMNALENDKEALLREVSNYLGWMFLRSLERQDHTDASVLLKSIEKLHRYSLRFDLSSSTRIFLLTLFVIVGSYSCIDPRNFRYRDRLADYLKTVSFEDIKLATEMRIQDNDSWDDIFHGRALEVSASFLSAVNKAQNR